MGSLVCGMGKRLCSLIVAWTSCPWFAAIAALVCLPIHNAALESSEDAHATVGQNAHATSATQGSPSSQSTHTRRSIISPSFRSVLSVPPCAPCLHLLSALVDVAVACGA